MLEEKLTNEQRTKSANRISKVRRSPLDTKYSDMPSHDEIRVMEVEFLKKSHNWKSQRS